MLCVVLAFGYWLSYQPQSWYVESAPPSPKTEQIAERAEYRLNEEFHKIRPTTEIWKVRITDEIMNAWLACRLEDWLTHDQELEIPPEVQNLQTHVSPEGIWVAAMVEIQEEEPRPLAMQLSTVAVDGNIAVTPVAVRLGKIPVPLSMLTGALGEDSNQPYLVSGRTPLMDDREVEILGIHLEEGSLILECKTHLP